MEHKIIFDTETLVEDALLEKTRTVILATLDEEAVQLPCEISVLFTDDQGIWDINKDMRDIDSPTDVLSFPMFELIPGCRLEGDALLDPETGLCPLGDMCISMERAVAQAQEFGHSVERELCYLAVHSVLHLLGYDHMDEGEQKRQMRCREEDILDKLGIVRGASN